MQVNVKRLVGESIGLFLAFVIALFLPAGTLVWPAGWIFLGMFFSFYLAVTAWLFRHSPGLVQERLQWGTSDQQGWDKLFFPLLGLFSLVWMVFIAPDLLILVSRRQLIQHD